MRDPRSSGPTEIGPRWDPWPTTAPSEQKTRFGGLRYGLA